MKYFKIFILPIFVIAILIIPQISHADINDEFLEAASKGDTIKVKNLIEQGADVNNKDKDGMTALMRAARGGHLETTKLLIEKGADVNAIEKSGYPVLIVTESMPFSPQLEIIKLLIESGADVNSKSKEGWTALMEAAKGHSYLRKGLIDKGRTDVAMVPLEIAKLLIEGGADVNVRYKDGRTALLVAAANGQTEIVNLLIEKGADINAVDMAGNTAMIYLIMGYDSLMKRLSKNKRMDLAKGFETIPVEIANILITAGADVNVKNKGGLTAYKFAIANRHTELAQLLKKAGGGLALSPIFSLKERLQFQGFSILPPQSDNWFAMDSDTKGIILGRYTGKEIHTIMVSARIEEYKDWTIKSSAEFLQYAKEKIEEGYKDSRFKPVDIKVSLECYRVGNCVRYDFTIEDHGSPYAPGSVLILTGYGFFFRHPYDDKYIVDINYSQRFPKGDKPLPAESEVEPFFKSLEFTPIK